MHKVELWDRDVLIAAAEGTDAVTFRQPMGIVDRITLDGATVDMRHLRVDLEFDEFTLDGGTMGEVFTLMGSDVTIYVASLNAETPT